MEHYRNTAPALQAGKTRWCHYQTGYHLVWIPRYRRKIFNPAVAGAFRQELYRTATDHGFRVTALETDRDHVHVFVSAPPRLAPTTIVGILKGRTSRVLRREFPWLAKTCGKERLWTRTSYIGTAGAVNAEAIRRYIEECQGTPKRLSSRSPKGDGASR